MAREALLVGLVFALFAVPASVVDYKSLRVPNVCTIGGLLIVGLVRVLALRACLSWVAGGACLGGGLFILARLLSGGRLGWGDIKLSALVGAAVGPLDWPPAVALGSTAAICWAVGVARRSRQRVRTVPIPFAPFLTAGALAMLGVRFFLPPA